jgi:hypothetical protein
MVKKKTINRIANKDFNKKWYKTFFYKYNRPAEAKDNTRIKKNIFGAKTVKENYFRHRTVHFILKYKIIVPAIWFINRYFGKWLREKIPSGNHNRNLRIHDKAWKSAMKKWVYYYVRNGGFRNQRMSKRQCDERVRNDPYLHIINKLIKTIYLDDTAYREFMNVYWHEMTNAMVKYYSKYPDKRTGHLFFTTDMYDVNYYVLEKMAEHTFKYQVEDAQLLLEEANKKNRRKRK